MVPSIGMALIMAIFWRIISYYVYLGIGAVIVPDWLRDSYNRLQAKKKGSSKVNVKGNKLDTLS